MTTSNKVLMERIEKWQKDPVFHNLTCGKNSKHNILQAREVMGRVELYCKDCNYVQHHIPELFHSNNFEFLYDEGIKGQEG